MRQRAAAVGGWAALVVALATATPSIAAACTCVTMPLCEALWTPGRGEPAFFAATVEAIEHVDAGTVRVRLGDVRAVHGRSATAVITSASDDSCGYRFVEGQRYLIDGLARRDGTMSTSLCSMTMPIENATAELAYLESLSRPSGGGRIFGEVFSQVPAIGLFDDEDRRPVAGVRLTLSGVVRRTTTTDREGRFSFENLPEGRYVVQGATRRGLRRSGGATAPIVLPNARACAETRLFYDRPRR